MSEETCPSCSWWKDGDRPHETFVYLSWEWDMDEARKMAAQEEGEVETATLAHIVDYPREPGKLRPFRVPVVEQHVDHVPLDEPLLIGLVRIGEEVATVVIDGHHRIARAVKDGVPKLKYRLLSEQQMLKCALSRPRNWRRKRRTG